MSGKTKSALITGTSSGIGEAVSKLLAQKGWTVFAGVRKEADGEKLRSFNSNIRPVILDVTKEDQVQSAMEQVRVSVGEEGLDVLVNSAGLAILGPIEFTPMEDVLKQYEVNILGLIRVTQAAMPLIRMGTPGRIINIGTAGSEMNSPYAGIYQSTKSALVTASECLRREVGQFGVKVALLQPGGVKTQFVGRMMTQENILDKFPAGSECHKHYSKPLSNLSNEVEGIMKGAVEVDVVANRVYQLICAKNPKNISCDTWNTWFQIWMVHNLPVWVVDGMMSKIAKGE